jgi:hypothetical protein
MKHFLLVFFFVATSAGLCAQQYQSLGNESSKPLYSVISSTPDETITRMVVSGH